MQAQPKPFTVRTETGEHSFIAYRSFNPVCVTISHIVPGNTEGSSVRFNVSMAQLAVSSFAGTLNKWDQVVDLAILSFKERNWAERVVAPEVAIQTFLDDLEIPPES